MISSVSRSGSLAASVIASSTVSPNAVRQIVPAVVQTSQKLVFEPQQDAHTSYTLSSRLPSATFMRPRATIGITAPSQVRFAHTDFQIPDFSSYRREGVKDPTKSSQETNESRRTFTYVIMAGGGVATAYAGKNLVTEFITSMTASADVLAMAKIEVKLGDIAEGKSAVFKWRNKPLFVRHRTAEEIETEKAVDVSSLRDQQHDDERVKKDEWLILLGVCTHLGCVPVANMGDFGGYYCPCHGSHYDASGRIRKGPAPLNLEIPNYEFMEDDLLVVG